MSSSVKTFGFAIAVCLVSSFLLTLAATSLKPLQDLNIKIDKQQNILKAIGLIDGETKPEKSEITAIFESQVAVKYVDSSGEYVEESDTSSPVYIVEEAGEVTRYAIPISGYGLWSTLYGFLAIEGDGETIAGITFYKHGETPGLGGEVEKPWFLNQFVGKKIVDENGKFVSVSVLKGKVSDAGLTDAQAINAVDGISGATITSVGVDYFLEQDLLKYEGFSKKLR